jgi:hypothetical protein
LILHFEFAISKTLLTSNEAQIFRPNCQRIQKAKLAWGFFIKQDETQAKRHISPSR